jgi:Zn ribbon nucleic-acid-binding protein
MIIAAAGATPPVKPCPRCNTPDGIQRLLTSMVRYYACSHCDFRWQVSRDRVSHDEMEVEGAESVLPVFSRD